MAAALLLAVVLAGASEAATNDQTAAQAGPQTGPQAAPRTATKLPVRSLVKTKASAAAIVPMPFAVESRSKPLARGRSKLVEFDTAPFPYRGLVPRTNKPFLDVNENGRLGHRTFSGHVYWEDETYSDRQVLLHLPKGFDIRRPALLIVFFHGHGAKLADDVYLRQQVPAQLSASGINAALIAPQLAYNAADSSAGKFWQPGAFARFLGEAARHLAKLHGDPKSVRSFARMPVVIVAYSGGYLTTAYCLHHGGIGNRLQGVVLFDALYGEIGTFADWIDRRKSTFFISTYTHSTEARNLQLQKILGDRKIPFTTALEPRLGPGDIAFLPASKDADHRDFLTYAWVDDPLKDLLGRLRRYARR